MKYTFVIVLTFVIITSDCLCLKHKQPTCRGQPIHMSDEDLQGLNECLKLVVPEVTMNETTSASPAPKNGEEAIPKDKMACLGKCFLEKEGLIDKKGMPCKDNLMKKINSTMPQEVMEELDIAIAKCVNEKGKNVDPKEESCMSYLPLTQCMTTAYADVCMSKDEKKKMKN